MQSQPIPYSKEKAEKAAETVEYVVNEDNDGNDGNDGKGDKGKKLPKGGAAYGGIVIDSWRMPVFLGNFLVVRSLRPEQSQIWDFRFTTH